MTEDLMGKKKWVLRVLLVLFALTAVVVIALVFFVGLARVQGDDMLPTYGDGAGLVVKRGGTPQRGDLILFDDHGVARIRRVIGMPNEHLEFDGMFPTVNGQKATYVERYEIDMYGRRMKVVTETIAGASHDVIDDPKRRLTNVPSVDTGNGYYVMSDFREYGRDSRVYGVIDPSSIRGIVWFAWSDGELPEPATGPPP